MNHCQRLHPDPTDSISDDEEEFMEAEEDVANIQNLHIDARCIANGNILEELKIEVIATWADGGASSLWRLLRVGLLLLRLLRLPTGNHCSICLLRRLAKIVAAATLIASATYASCSFASDSSCPAAAVAAVAQAFAALCSDSYQQVDPDHLFAAAAADFASFAAASVSFACCYYHHFLDPNFAC
uniref:Uncharacterized protein n=2 Tax=Lutzomyia longipalpis TaxID=7200 RepID=A0A1B0GJK7_LUTLO